MQVFYRRLATVFEDGYEGNSTDLFLNLIEEAEGLVIYDVFLTLELQAERLGHPIDVDRT